MSMNAYLIGAELIGLAGLSVVGWKDLLPYLRAKKFKRNPYYLGMMKVAHEHQESIVKTNSSCWKVKDNKIFITQSISAKAFDMLGRRYLFDRNVAKEFFVDLIADHIKKKPNCFIEFYECAEKNTLLYQQTSQKMLDLLSRYGVPNRHQRKILSKDIFIEEEAFCVVVELVITTVKTNMSAVFELPCDYIKNAFEKL